MIKTFGLLILILLSPLFSSENEKDRLKALDLPKTLTGKAWEKIGIKNHYGIDVPLLSLWSHKNSGCGEFENLYPLIDWLHSMDMGVLQLLPLNDTADTVSPYSPVSFYALHPIYLSLHVLPFLDHAPEALHLELNDLKEYNSTQRIDYSRVLSKKNAFLEKYVHSFKKELLTRDAYQKFMDEASYWITDYALYKVLSKKYGPNWVDWPKNLQYPQKQLLDRLKKTFKEEMIFYQIVQSLCFEQFINVHKYANAHSVFLAGDFTYLVQLGSSNVWLNPHLFKLNKSMGVPSNKDYPNGQYWGLPPYNWRFISESKNTMILERVRTFSRLYDMYRLDSSEGYFKQFEIPLHKAPKQGAFVPSSDEKAFLMGQDTILQFIKQEPDLLPFAEAIGLNKNITRLLQSMGMALLSVFLGSDTHYAASSPEFMYDGQKLFSNPMEHLTVFMLSIKMSCL